MSIQPLTRIFQILITAVAPLYASAFVDYDYWDGDVSSTWNSTSNWESNAYPSNYLFNDIVMIDGSHYTNAPVVSGTMSMTREYLRITNGGVLTLNAGTSETYSQDIIIDNGGSLVINGGAISTSGNDDNLYITDVGTSVTVSGGTLTLGGTSSFYIGEDHPNLASSNTAGATTLTINGGTANVTNVYFGPRDSGGSLVVSSGTINISNSLSDNSQNMSVTISGTGVINISNDLSSTRAGNSMTLNGGTLNIVDEWNQNGTVSATGGTVSFNGTTSQTITKTGGTEFYNLTVNNSSTGLILADPVTVNGLMTFTDGIVASTSTDILIFDDGATVSGASDASHVDGPVRKVGDEAFTFPTGDGGNYQSIGISAPTSATDAFEAQYFFVNPAGSYQWNALGPGLDNVSTREYWILNRTAGTSSASVTLAFDANSGGVTSLSDLRVARWDGTEWTDAGNSSTSGTVASGTVTSNAVSSFSPFTNGDAGGPGVNPLPVEFLGWQVGCNAMGNAEITWSTASEANSQRFVILASTDGITWDTVAEIPAAGFTNQRHDYRCAPEIGSEVSQVQLHEIDFDGSVTQLAVADINCASDAVPLKMLILPNPCTGLFSILVPDETADYTVQAFNETGAPIELKAIGHQWHTSVHGLLNVVVTTSSKTYSGRILVVE